MTQSHRPKRRYPDQVLLSAQNHWKKGVEHSKNSDWARAAASFRMAVSKVPTEAVYLLNLAWMQTKQYQFDDALKTALQVLALDPDQTIAREMAASILTRQHRYSEASDLMLALPEHLPRDAQYYYDLGSSLFTGGRYKESISILFEGLQHDISHALSHYRMGLSFNALDMKPEASECLRTALTLGLGPGNISAQTLLTFLEREMCRWDRAQADLEVMNGMIRDLPENASSWTSGFSCAVLCTDPELIFRGVRSCAEFFAQRLPELPPMGHRPLGERLRVGFVSADMHQHATAILMAEVFVKLDKSRFEVSIFSHGPDDKSPMRQRLIRAVEHFHDVTARSDIETAHQIRDSQIDVLIDLKGHTKDNRLGLFACRAAPVQVSYLGFPATSGAEYIDYFIGDPVASPLEHQPYYTEKLALMPICYQPNDRKRPLPKTITRAELGLPEDALVLCGFNQPFKLTPEILKVWAGLLKELPDAVLWLLGWNKTSRAPILACIENEGVDPARVIFAPRVGNAEHMTRMAQADIFIDTWPCNGHTTASDALWNGVPVVTYAGQTFASRVAASLLNAVGLPELICNDLDSYRAQVLRLGRDAQARRALRDHLIAARETADLFDSDTYTRDFGRLLWAMAERWAQGLPAAPFQLEALPRVQAQTSHTDGVAP